MKGKNPTKAEFSLWTPSRWMDYLRFVDFFLDKDKYSVTKDKLLQVQEWKLQSDHPWLEFFERVNRDEEKAYTDKLRIMNMQAMKFLEIRPALVTDEMKVLMQKNPNIMGKYLRVSPIVEVKDVAIVPAPVSKQTQVLSDTIDVLQVLVDKLKKEGVGDMSVKEMISALPKIVDAINKMQGRVTKIGNLTLINTQGSVEDMERQMLGMVGKQE